jgi:hypothetical protein
MSVKPGDGDAVLDGMPIHKAIYCLVLVNLDE